MVLKVTSDACTWKRWTLAELDSGEEQRKAPRGDYSEQYNTPNLTILWLVWELERADKVKVKPYIYWKTQAITEGPDKW